MAQQMKANVLIYTETNRSFIQQKVYDQFKFQCLKDDELKDLDSDKMLKVMKQIFDFGQDNKYMQQFFKKVPDSIQRFIAEQYKNTNQTEDLIIDINKLIDIIYACIEYGFQKQQKQQPIQQKILQNPQIKQVRQQKIQKKIKIEQKPQEQPEKVKKFYVPKPKTPQKKNFIQKYEMPQKKMPARYLMHINKPEKKQQQTVLLPQVKPLDENFIEKNRLNLQKRLQNLYRHYCSQQQNVGQHTTFDRIKQQCSQMTIGKFLLFCKVVKVFDDKDITKQILSSKFKKIAEGKKQIQFDKFKQLLALVDQQYITIKRKKLTEDQIIPTFQARLMLQGNEYKKLKKDVDLPFYTRQKEGRELQKYTTLQNPRYVKKDQLTPHSGKFGKDLKLQIQRKLASQSIVVKSKQKNQKTENSSKSKIVRLDNIKFQNFPQMDWVIQQDQNDKIFMKQYRNRDVVGELKKRVTDLQKMQKSKVF